MITFDDWNIPSTCVIAHFANVFDIAYHKTEEDLNDTFSKPFSFSSIRSRVEKLDRFYHTGLKRVGRFEMIVEKIQKYGEDLESRIKVGDLDVIEIIADNEGYNCFSFATKYCSFVNNEAYALYDDRVCKILNRFQKNKDTRFYHERFLKLDDVRKKCDYRRFIGIIDDFKRRFKLTCSYKDLDKFLWLVGSNLSVKDGDPDD